MEIQEKLLAKHEKREQINREMRRERERETKRDKARYVQIAMILTAQYPGCPTGFCVRIQQNTFKRRNLVNG